MRKLIEACPACDGELIVTQQSCVRCGTAVSGQFQPTIFSRLSSDNLAFLEVFVKNRGNVKEMERELGQSYWTIRNRINQLIEELGLEAAAETVEAENLSDARQVILSRLEAGEIDVAEAKRLLAELAL